MFDMLLPLLLGGLCVATALWDSRGDPEEEPDPDTTPTEGDDSLTVSTDAGGVFDARGGDDSVTVGAETGADFTTPQPTVLIWNTEDSGPPLSVTGGEGDDTLSLSGGGYSVTGGAGADVISLGDARDVAVSAAAGDTVVGGTGDGNHILLTQSAMFQGGAADDYVVTASTGAVSAGAGNDAVIGIGGAASVSGGEGEDWLVGTIDEFYRAPTATSLLSQYTSFDADTLDGGAGNDVIWASHGDLVSTGTGSDSVTTFLDAGAGYQPTTVTDFDSTMDQLQIVFDSYGMGDEVPPALAGTISLTEADGATLITDAGGQVLVVLQGTTGLTAGIRLSEQAPLTDLAGNPTPQARYDIILSRFQDVTS